MDEKEKLLLKAWDVYSRQLINHVREREGDILRLFIALGGTLTLYGTIIKWYQAADLFVEYGTSFNLWFLIFGTIIVQLIFSWVGCFILANAYNYRSLMCIIGRIQNKLDILQFKPKTWSPWLDEAKQRPCHKERWELKYTNTIGKDTIRDNRKNFSVFDLVPEISKIHFYAIIGFNFVLTLTSYLILNKAPSLFSPFVWVTFFISLFILYRIEKVYYGKLCRVDFLIDKQKAKNCG